MAEKLYLGSVPFVNSGLTLGDGGQATVVEQDGWAVKCLKTIEPDQLSKIKYLLGNPPKMEDRFIFPKVPLSTKPNGAGELRGYGMLKMPPNFRELGVLFNSSLRKSLRITTPTMLEILKVEVSDIELIHRNIGVVGDLSGRNSAFVFGKRGVTLYWYDTDSWQVAGIRCPVWTEYFLCPDLYQQSQAGRIKYTNESDWYGFWTILFWSLLGVHPYLQAHPKYLDFRERARNGVWYLSKGVMQTSLAAHPDTVSDDLLGQFENVFGKHKFEAAQIKLLDDYQRSLVECGSCGVFYPNTRKSCPKCTTQTPSVDFQPTYVCEPLVKTVGEIVLTRFQAGTLYVISREKSGYYLMIRPSSGKVVKVFIDVDPKDVYRFDIAGEYLAINEIDSEVIYLTHISAPGSKWMRTESEIFLGNRQIVFRGTAKGLLRQTGSKLILSRVEKDRFLEKQLPAGVAAKETWVWSNSDGEKIVTLSRLFGKLHVQLISNERRFSLDQEDLAFGDSLRETAVYFGNETVCLRRVVNRNGRATVLTETFDLFGKTLFRSSHLLSKMPGIDIHHVTYEDGEIYWQTDLGMVIENVERNSFVVVPKTEKLVSAVDRLIHLGGRKHFLVVREKSVNYLILN